MHTPKSIVVLGLFLFLLTSCGGGGSEQFTPAPSPPPSFSISISPSTSQSNLLSVTMGSAGTKATVTVVGQNGFTGVVDLVVDGMPNGVTASPNGWTQSAGQAQDVVLTADANAPAADFQATIRGSSGTLSASVELFGKVILPPNSAVVDQAGGTIIISDSSSPIDGVRLDISVNALSQPTLIQINPVPTDSLPQFSSPMTFAGIAVELLPLGLQFSIPATLSLPFKDLDRDGVIDGSNVLSQTLIPVSFDEQTQLFTRVEAFVDTTQQLVISDIPHFSRVLLVWGRYLSNQIVTYTFGNLPSNRIGTEGDLRSAITRALATWSQELRRSGISFAPAPAGSSPHITFTSLDAPDIACFIYGIGAPISWDGKVPAHVIFNNNPCYQTPQGVVFLAWTGIPGTLAGTLQIEAVALHEIGHVLGHLHSCQNCRGTTCPAHGPNPVTNVMAKFIDPLCPLVSLGRGDVAAYRRHYGLLYAESGVGTSGGPSVLYTVDPVSPGADVPVGLISLDDGTTPVITDLALSSSGDLFGISFDTLYKIDILTTRADIIGPLGLSGFNALSFDRQDVLYGASTSGQFAKIDLSTGAAQPVGFYGSGFVSSGDIVFVPTGTAYGTATRLGDLTDQLIKIDPASGQASHITDLGRSRVFGFVWVPGSSFGPWTPCFPPLPCKTYLFFGLTTDGSVPTATGDLILVNPVAGTSIFVRKLSFGAFGGAAIRLADREEQR